MSIAVHVTHKAIRKIGGIGTVLQGLLTTRQYNLNIERTFLIGPLHEAEAREDVCLGEGGEVLYSSSMEIGNTSHADELRKIEESYQVTLLYGRRRLVDNESGVVIFPEVILVDVSSIALDQLNAFKLRLFERFSIESDRYEGDWEYEEYVRLAEPGYYALRALIDVDADMPCFIIAHEFMGMPLALKAILDGQPNIRTVFYAHEVATVRLIIENHPDHDTRFYIA